MLVLDQVKQFVVGRVCSHEGLEGSASHERQEVAEPVQEEGDGAGFYVVLDAVQREFVEFGCGKQVQPAFSLMAEVAVQQQHAFTGLENRLQECLHQLQLSLRVALLLALVQSEVDPGQIWFVQVASLFFVKSRQTKQEILQVLLEVAEVGQVAVGVCSLDRLVEGGVCIHEPVPLLGLPLAFEQEAGQQAEQVFANVVGEHEGDYIGDASPLLFPSRVVEHVRAEQRVQGFDYIQL